MRCIRFNKYGPPEVLKVVECDMPLFKNDEVLIQVFYSSVQAADWRIRSMSLPRGMTFFGRLFFGFFKPRKQILGTELSGVVKEVGSSVTQFKKGDEVVAVMGARLGAHAEYVVLNSKNIIVKKPKSISYQEAAVAAFGSLTAYDFLTYKVKIKNGDRILIHGASGPVGTVAIQIAKNLGAHVTAVCSQKNFELVRSLGVDECIDYLSEGFKKSQKKFDVIFDVTGFLSASNSFSALNPGGQLILISASLYEMLSSVVINLLSSKKVVVGVTTESAKNLEWVLEQIETGKLKIILDQEFAMDQIVEAHRYVEARHRRGNVVLRIGGGQL